MALFVVPNLVWADGLVPIVRPTENPGLCSLADRWLSVSTDNGANAGRKVALVADMAAGADSIGIILRAYTFGHVHQLDPVGRS